MKCPVCGHESDGVDVADNYDSVPLKGFKMYCKKVQSPKHMQKKTICHMR